MKLFYLFVLFQTEKFSRLQILARPVGLLCLSSHSPSKKEIFIILLPTSMATSKNIQASTTATSVRLGMATTNNYIGAINLSQPKASNQLQSQSTKEAKVQTIISLDPLTRNKVINKDVSTLEHLKYGGKSPSSFTRSWSHDFSPFKRNPKDKISRAHFKIGRAHV